MLAGPERDHALRTRPRRLSHHGVFLQCPAPALRPLAAAQPTERSRLNRGSGVALTRRIVPGGEAATRPKGKRSITNAAAGPRFPPPLPGPAFFIATAFVAGRAGEPPSCAPKNARRTFAVQRSRAFEQLATRSHPCLVRFFARNAQKVSPAQAPSLSMTAGKDPSRLSRAEHALASTPQIPMNGSRLAGLSLNSVRSVTSSQMSSVGKS